MKGWLVELNQDIVAIYAHLCGDGNLYVYSQNRSPSSKRLSRSVKPFKRYVFEYTNTSSKLLDYVTTCIQKLFPQTYVYRQDKRYRIKARSKDLYLLMRRLGYKNGNHWVIPLSISENSQYRKIWLRAFFDDEGSVYENCLVCSNTNYNAMKTIQKMLEVEGLATSLYGIKPKFEKYKICYRIRIKSASYLQFKKIGFNHEKKAIKYAEFYKKRCTGREIRDFK